MLTLAIMGHVALWILWGNTLLVAVAAAQRALSLLRRARACSPAALAPGSSGMIEGRVVSGEPFAEHAVQQTGRVGAGDEPTILWHDRAYESRILGGQLQLDGGELVDVPATREGARVWLSAEAMESAARCDGPERFSSAYADARRVKGFARTVVGAIRPGARLFATGMLRQAPGGWTLSAEGGELAGVELRSRGLGAQARGAHARRVHTWGACGARRRAPPLALQPARVREHDQQGRRPARLRVLLARAADRHHAAGVVARAARADPARTVGRTWSQARAGAGDRPR